MSSKSKRLVESSGSDSDSGPDDRDEPQPKKAKGDASKNKKPAPKPKPSNDDEEPTFQLAKMRYVKVREFKGKVYVDIREYYNDASGDMKPGKKGISLSVEQWNTLKENMDNIDEALKNF